MEKQRYEDCEDDQRHEEELYRRELQLYERCKKLQKGNDAGCYRPVNFPSRYCSRDTQGCIELYNRCYMTCGGQVESQQVCTYGCD